MSEPSGRPTESEPVAQAASGEASAHLKAAPPADPVQPVDAAQPIDSGQPVGGARPIEVGDGPFQLSGSADEDEADTPKPKSRTRTVVLAGLLAVGVAGAAALSVTGWRVMSQKDATLTAPAELGGLKADDSENGRGTADYLTTALAAEIDFDKTVGAVYRDGANPSRGVLFFGGTSLIWSPDTELESAFDLIADDQGSVTDVHDVEAGDLGGTMKCGATATAEGDMSVCGWADHGSLTVGLFPGRPEDESAILLRTFRDVAQKRD
ncbi:hypothetical protein [Actinoplanes sp. NBRC 103695]|uniref:hypothetical protein n=1 Tax=Actinoplanes sp. NBRC 103695 TaxID=3032202 RepID=UPI0024A52B08|nr:hypothetical protein [Actinoplanes sp. NBRC 103695]GLZ00854.1 hypothetical protein Acsp02_81060 [Actinoplanes sp. NBRC 103695]